jgi:class 3 adenylate cyclase
MLSRLRSLLRLFVGSRADRVILGALFMILVNAMVIAFFRYPLANPDAARFLDREVLGITYAVMWGSQAVWVVFLLTGLLARTRWPDSRLPTYAFNQFYILQAVFLAYIFGPYTDPLGQGMLFAGTIAQLPLFGSRVVRAGIATFLVAIVVTTVAERLDMIPYAPLLAEAPYQGGHLSDFGFLFGLFNSLLLLIGVLVFVQVSQRLRRATFLIRRYVPAQLAEQILAGRRTGAAHPERRKVTLFFSDVVGFTEAADQMEPEDLSAHLNEYLSEMARIAEAHGATINQFVGDGIMIFFGAPEVTNDRDHALRAVRMALVMQRRMAELGEKWFAEGIQTPFRIRVGINTGVASVGDFGSEGRTAYSAIGNQTNLTARIQDHCEPGKVLISHTTWALVKDEIACEEHGEIEVKGLHYPVRVYEVVEEGLPDTGNA